jgi:hypothetical protein
LPRDSLFGYPAMAVGIGQAMSDKRKAPGLALRRRALLASSVLALWPFATASAAVPVTLQVVTLHALLGLHHSALSRYLAAQMARVGLADWRFEPLAGNGLAANRVEWTFKLSPYAGGEVRSFVHTLSHEERFEGRRPVTIEARLYLDGEYQTLVQQQALVGDNPHDPDLAAAVVSATRNLLGPRGAYRAIDMGGQRAPQEK